MFDLFRSGRNASRGAYSAREQQAMLQALDKSQAVIQFAVDGTVLDANANFLDALGYTLQEIKGQHHSMFVEPKEVQSAAYNKFWDSLRRGEFQSAEYKRLGKGGKEIWIQASYNPILDTNGKPYKVVKYATDITEQTLLNSDFSGQIDAISKSQAVIQFDLTGKILTANENFLNAVGYGLKEVEGQHHSVFVDPDYSASAEYANFWKALGRGEYQAAEYKRIGKGGREIWIQASYNPIFDPSGKPFKVVKYATDITVQVLARDEEALMNETLKTNLGKILTFVSSANEQSTSASAAANETAQTVQTVAAATEEFEASSQEIARSMATTQEEVTRVVADALAADRSTQKLSEAAVAMSNIIQMIQEIAGQINLLALNATIESARAGDAGKGFAVVASEVKSLANQVAKATDDIGVEISGMQTIAEEVVSRLGGVNSAMEKVEVSVTTVASAVEEQSASTAEMTSTMQSVSQAVQDVNVNLAGVAKSVDELSVEGEEMSRSLQKNRAVA